MAREYYKHIQQFSKSKYNLVNSSIQYSGSDFLHHQLNACRFPRQRNAKKRTPFALLWAHGCVWWRCQYLALADYKCNVFPQLEISSVHREYGHGKPADQSGLWLLSLHCTILALKSTGLGESERAVLFRADLSLNSEHNLLRTRLSLQSKLPWWSSQVKREPPSWHWKSWL